MSVLSNPSPAARVSYFMPATNMLAIVPTMGRTRALFWGRANFQLVAWFLLAMSLYAPDGTAQNRSMSASMQSSAALPQNPQPASTTGNLVGISLKEAITRARSNEPNFAAAVAASKVAKMDTAIAKAALLPGVVYHNQYLYSQPQLIAPGTTFSAATRVPRFIANNATHEYISQAVVSETIGLQQIASVAQTSALSEVAVAQLEVARRGLVAAVIALYYNVSVTQNKVAIAQQALSEAVDFSQLTQKLEIAREAAHADVIKAELGVQQRERDLSDAKLAAEKAKLELGILLFTDPHSNYTIQEGATLLLLDSRDALQAATNQDNPEIRGATANLRAANFDLMGARAAYLPDLSMNYYYGIDAPQFAVNGPDGGRNLGYAAMVTLDIPVWDWFTTHDLVRQKASLRNSAKVALTAAQRQVIANFDEAYAEAKTAQDQLTSFDDSVKTARDSLRLTRLRYTSGEATVLEVVDAESSYTTAQLAREDGFLRYQTALANLQMLTGKF